MKKLFPVLFLSGTLSVFLPKLSADVYFRKGDSTPVKVLAADMAPEHPAAMEYTAATEQLGTMVLQQLSLNNRLSDALVIGYGIIDSTQESDPVLTYLATRMTEMQTGDSPLEANSPRGLYLSFTGGISKRANAEGAYDVMGYLQTVMETPPSPNLPAAHSKILVDTTLFRPNSLNILGGHSSTQESVSQDGTKTKTVNPSLFFFCGWIQNEPVAGKTPKIRILLPEELKATLSPFRVVDETE